ncbi:MAG: hypothetical protein OEV60_11355, partial [Actinomycetota bacterium]|nr:hypothetical protein [Actinomycetota bacterium]
RPPKREPVAVPTPFLRRRWVQVTAGFLVGVLSMMLGLWVTNNLREADAQSDADARAADRLAAATAYQQAVRSAYGKVGVVDPGVPPTILAEMNAALDALAKGNAQSGVEDVFARAAADAGKARKELAGFDIASTVADQGFNAVSAAAYTGSAATLIQVLAQYRQAALIAASATAVGGPEGERLTDVAVELRDTAQAQLIQGWTTYLQALEAGGRAEGPPGGSGVPGLPGG